jgi:RND family efflux transporter MFP subunit
MGNKRILLVAGSLAAFITFLPPMAGGVHAETQGDWHGSLEQNKKPVKTATVELLKTRGEIIVSGTVVARQTAVISSRISGYVVDLKVSAGDHVKAGQELLRIDTTELADQETQAKASLASATADLENAKTNFDRYRPLFESQAISKQKYDDIRNRYEVALAAQQRAQAALDLAGTQISYGILKAPFDGIIADRTANVGDLAMPGQPLLTVYMPGTLELVAPVGEQFSRYVKEGTHVVVENSSIGLNQSTSIREVVPQTDTQTKTITVKAPLSDMPGLTPGIYGTLSFDTATSEVMAVPLKAIRKIGQLETVRVLRDSRFETRYVSTGRKLRGGKIEILSGLKSGERVVIE